MKVRFLYFSGCPNAELALEFLEEALRNEAPDTEIERTEVKSDEEAVRYSFLGSPSIQIDGVDIEKERRGDLPFYGCRFYMTKTGPVGVPPKELILEAVREAKRERRK